MADRLEGRSLLAVILVVTGGVLPTFLTAAASVQVRAEFGFRQAGLGLTVAVFFGAAACTSAVLGRVAERVGPARSMRASAAISSLVLLGIAVGARSFVLLLALLAAGGAANALSQPAANLFIARTFTPSKLGLAFAIKQSGVPAATLIGGLAVPTLVVGYGWRAAFVVAALLPALGVLLVPAVRSQQVPVTAAAAAAAAAGRRRGGLAVLASVVGLGAAAAGSLGGFLVDAGVEAGMAEGSAGLLVAVGSATGIAARLLAGASADRRGSAPLRSVAVMLALGSVGYLLYATGIVPVMVLATPLAFGAGWGWPGLFNLAVVHEYAEAPGRASGVTQTGTYLGAVLGPLLFGWLAQTAGYGAAWTLAAACALTAAGVLVVRGRVQSCPVAPAPA